MNTLGDTDEEKARPSVWPVYAAAATIGFVSLFGGLLVLPQLAHPAEVEYAVAGYVLFGVLTCFGVAWLRPWGWWCAVVWTIILLRLLTLGTPSMLLVFRYYSKAHPDQPLASWLVPGLVLVLSVWGAFTALLVWPLVARRQLFFPPNPEREE